MATDQNTEAPPVVQIDHEKMWDSLRVALLQIAQEDQKACVNAQEMVGVMRMLETQEAVRASEEMRAWMATL